MIQSSYFRQFAHLITVADICTPLIDTFDANTPSSNVFDSWNDTCYERYLDPMEQIALIKKGDKQVGWVGFDMIKNDVQISECMEQIDPDAILSADTSLIDAIAAFSETTHPFFFILRGNQFVGALFYQDLHRLPFRVCLYVMLINLEQMLLDVILNFPLKSLEILSLREKRYDNAKKIYVIRYGKNEEKENILKLLECTTMVDKIAISRELIRRKIIHGEELPSLNNSRMCNVGEKLRNEIAHPNREEKSSVLLTREKLSPFVKWAEVLESELERLLSKINSGEHPSSRYEAFS